MIIYVKCPIEGKICTSINPLKNCLMVHPEFAQLVYKDKNIYEVQDDVERIFFFNSLRFLLNCNKDFNFFGYADRLYRCMNLNFLEYHNNLGKKVLISLNSKCKFHKGFDLCIKPFDIIPENSIIMIDLTNMSIEILYSLLNTLGPKVYFVGQIYNCKFEEKWNCKIDNDEIFATGLKILKKDLAGVEFKHVDIKYLPYKKNNLNTDICNICKENSGKVVSVNSYCRITDETEKMEFICDKCR